MMYGNHTTLKSCITCMTNSLKGPSTKTVSFGFSVKNRFATRENLRTICGGKSAAKKIVVIERSYNNLTQKIFLFC
jgi:hypothetical protein